MKIKRIPGQGNESLEDTLKAMSNESDKEWSECGRMLLDLVTRLNSQMSEIEIWAGISQCNIFFTHQLNAFGPGGVSAWNGEYTITKFAGYSNGDPVYLDIRTKDLQEATNVMLEAFAGLSK